MEYAASVLIQAGFKEGCKQLLNNTIGIITQKRKMLDVTCIIKLYTKCDVFILQFIVVRITIIESYQKNFVEKVNGNNKVCGLKCKNIVFNMQKYKKRIINMLVLWANLKEYL